MSAVFRGEYNAAERLTAAADKIQEHLDVAATMPWRAAEQTHDEWVGIQNNYVAIGSTFSGSDAGIAALAVNALPAVAAWLRTVAKTHGPESPMFGWDHANQRAEVDAALAVADQILGGAR